MEHRYEPVDKASARWVFELATNGRVVVPISPTKIALVVVMSLVATGFGVGIIVATLRRGFEWSHLFIWLVGGMCVLFFGVLIIPRLVRQLLSGERLVVDRHGLAMNHWSVAWSEVWLVTVREHYHPPFTPEFMRSRSVDVRVTDDAWARHMSTQSPLVQRLGGRQQSARIIQLPSTLAARPTRLAAWLDSVRQSAMTRG